jgi:tetraacyldisaccharide 4'-kinase
VERWLTRVWYERARGGAALVPLSWAFAVLVKLRRRAYVAGFLRATRLEAPVVVVGNLTVGGTGKTPLVVSIAQALTARGRRVGIVSRGYGGSAAEPMLVDEAAPPELVGDEPWLLQRRTGLPVAIGRDRVAAARLLLARGVDVIVSDDGLQHYALARDVEIAVIDAARGLGNARLLPAGPLREPADRLAGADALVLNGGPRREWPQAFVMRLVPDDAVHVAGREQPRPLERFRGVRVHAVAGIGHPERFFAMLREAGLEVIPHPFPDHHAFARAELDFGDALPVLATEKDAVKCRAFDHPRLWCVPVRCELDGRGSEELMSRIEARLGSRK